MNISLDRDEVMLLHRILEHQLGELKGEIAHTDNSRFKDGLKGEKEILVQILDKVAPAHAH